MNKKISTLLAGAALLGAVSTYAAPGDAVSSLKPDANGWNAGMYQLIYTNGGTDYALATVKNAQGDAELQLVPFANGVIPVTNLSNSLWCVQVKKQDQGQAPKYEFLNKGNGVYLDIPYAGTAAVGTAETITWSSILGGEIAGWAFSKTFENVLEPNKPLYSYFKNDSVIGLQATGTDIVYSKLGANRIGTSDDKFAQFTLKSANEYILDEAQVNTVMSSQLADAGVKLTFAPDVKGTDIKNPFNSQDFYVEQAEAGYLYVKTKEFAYLKVDTAFTNETGVKFLAYAWSNATDFAAATALKDQYKFQFKYSPSNDSLTIYVKEVTVKENGKSWAASKKYNETSNAGADERYKVSLQDLIKDQIRILTAAPAQNTLIHFGIESCVATKSNKTSVENGVYYIKNKAGKYLASPIYNNGVDAMWVSVNTDEQSPAHMPAYQWVVLKTNESDRLKATSAVSITNREFANLDVASVQLFKKEGATYMYVAGNAMLGIATDSLMLEAVPAESVTNKYLGYSKIVSSDLLVNKYNFNYWHPYATDKFIAQSAVAGDSTLTVLNGKTSFTLVEGKESAYGYDAKKAANKIKDLELAQLYRTEYAVKIANKSMGVAAENKYAVGSFAVVDSFYFKENNHIGGKHYYAIVEEAAHNVLNNQKAGVSDYDGAATLKAQVLAETRTSAFAIAKDDVPLYRRFNCAALNEKADDSADTLSFVESIRHEYLMDEMNKNLLNSTTDYAGIWAKDKSKGLSFHVDTAWVERGFGYIKPQYLISVDRHEVAAIPGVPCTYEHNHYDNAGNKVDAAHCSHATQGKPGYNVAKYLVSFADSIAKDNASKPMYTDVKGGYTRVGFVKAIQEGDSLYFLVNGFEKKANTELSVAEVVAAYKKAGIYDTYVRPLTKDVHKNYTWSFRYVNPEKAANEVEADRSFLIESNIYDANEKAIAPEKAAWLKMQNGYLVLTDKNSTFSNTKTGGDGALVFNVDKEANGQLATDNEGVTTSEVSVIASEGVVTIKGAAGKKVVISNILGQTIVSTVLTSDNETIAVPAGIVVVAVEGEAAVKAIVK